MTTFPGLSITNSLLQLCICMIHDTAKDVVLFLRIRAITDSEDSFVTTEEREISDHYDYTREEDVRSWDVD